MKVLKMITKAIDDTMNNFPLADGLPYPGWVLKLTYNIPRACLLNRSPVPTMDLKSNRSVLWRHILETCRRLRKLCRKHSKNVARHDKTPVKWTLLSRDMIKLQLSEHFCRATWVPCRVGVTVRYDFYTFRSCITYTFSDHMLAVLRHTT